MKHNPLVSTMVNKYSQTENPQIPANNMIPFPSPKPDICKAITNPTHQNALKENLKDNQVAY